MAGRQIYKSTDWKIIWTNTLISEPAGDNHQKKVALEQNFKSQIEAIKSQIKP